MSAKKPHEPDTGVVFENSEKWRAAKEKRPHLSGECSVTCNHCGNVSRKRIAIWFCVSKQRGVAYWSLAFSEPKGGAE